MPEAWWKHAARHMTKQMHATRKFPKLPCDKCAANIIQQKKKPASLNTSTTRNGSGELTFKRKFGDDHVNTEMSARHLHGGTNVLLAHNRCE